MNDHEIRTLIGSVMVAGFESTNVDEHLKTLIHDYRVENFILFSRNVRSVEQVKELTEATRILAFRQGLDNVLFCIDEENGVVSRLPEEIGRLPGNMALGATQDVVLAERAGILTGRALCSMGITMNLAPVLDVNNNPQNPVIGVRSFGEHTDLVGNMGAAMINGLHQEGIIACAKHFPGHGDVTQDSHLALPVIAHGMDRLLAVELPPFQMAMQNEVDAIMTAHVVFSAVDPHVPATMSRSVLTDLVRGELGYNGVIMTDCLEMNAISQTVGVGQGAVLALAAGADMILVSHQLERQVEAIEAVLQSIKSGRLPLDRLIEASDRVKLMKQKYSGLQNNTINMYHLKKQRDHFAHAVGAKAVTIFRNEDGVLPIQQDDLRRIYVVTDDDAPLMQAAGARNTTKEMLHEVSTIWADLPIISLNIKDDLSSLKFVSQDLIFVWINGAELERYADLVRGWNSIDGHMVVMALRSPYDIAQIPARTVLCLFEDTPWMMRSALETIFTGQASGVMPVTFNH